MTSITVNPVIGRELTERLRGFRAFLAISIFVWVLALAMFLVFEGNAGTSDAFDLSARTGVGRLVFETVVLMMTVLVLFFVPGLTAGAIAGERERQTLATLQVTMLRTRSILFGKVAAALVFLLLMIVAALPVLAVSYLLGGIRIADIFMGVLAVFIVALLVATMVVAVSSFAKRVQTATLLAYGFTAVLSFIGPLVYGILMLFDNRTATDENAAPAWIATINPFALVADLGSGNRASGDGPLAAIRELLAEIKARNDNSWWAWFPKRVSFADVDEARFAGRPLGAGPAAWVLSTASLTLIAAVLVLFAIRRLRTPAEVER
jgi:ABC-type transport system involved in multi-copper enzyme maturation permease subunit